MTKKPEDRILVAIRTGQDGFRVVGARQGYAGFQCAADLSLAPAGRNFLRENPGVRAPSAECALAAGPDSVEAAPGAVGDMVADRVRRAGKHPLN